MRINAPINPYIPRNEPMKGIRGNAKVCDGRTGECWEVKEGKKGETPPVKKSPPSKTTPSKTKSK